MNYSKSALATVTKIYILKRQINCIKMTEGSQTQNRGIITEQSLSQAVYKITQRNYGKNTKINKYSEHCSNFLKFLVRSMIFPRYMTTFSPSSTHFLHLFSRIRFLSTWRRRRRRMFIWTTTTNKRGHDDRTWVYTCALRNTEKISTINETKI